MLYHYVDVLTPESEDFGIAGPQIVAVAVAVDGTEQRCHGLKFVSHLHRTDVAGMPNLITLSEILLIFRVPVTVSIADNTYSFHSILNHLRTKSAINFSVSSIPRWLLSMQRS